MLALVLMFAGTLNLKKLLREPPVVPKLLPDFTSMMPPLVSVCVSDGTFVSGPPPRIMPSSATFVVSKSARAVTARHKTATARLKIFGLEYFMVLV